ncbi:hypothetical protein ASG92_05935 [Arthrobacter sp. Soil736]|uniref:hypothetical protein n=1 Tax=Arthrobacter sp. Soil736 TaxID=1736395 RepID=UPI0006FD291B|nr:hypothetical protein [Arthrobacter sp. Soil736]KRE53094.1 hypothetical protein ASG92_05935 [Arthrobacter sp. Soil736]
MKSNSGFGGWRPILVLVFAASMGLSGCAAVKTTAAPAGQAAATMEKAGTDLNRLTLTDKAVERLGVTTAKVTKGTGSALEIPYGSLVYDATGKTWVYTNPESRTYIRAAVTVDRITGNRVLLRSGPPAGTDVVTVGAAELFGAEFGTKGH